MPFKSAKKLLFFGGNMKYIDLTEDQQNQYESLINETLPEGQFFWLEDDKVYVASKNLYPLWLAQGNDETQVIEDI